MARPKEFDKELALDAAIGVFREHGFEGTSAGMLTEAMKIGRQSLYDTFGDKWRLYCAAVARYVEVETRAHLSALRGASRAIDGLGDMMQRVVVEARRPCLGIGSICEFGRRSGELSAIHDAAHASLQAAIVRRVGEAQAAGDVRPDLDPQEAAGFLLGNVAAIRLAARGGADDAHLAALGRLALRALR
ncbi:TetR/AcrR family transcriptional regulator [Ancylobacter sp. Lp-2]|uniref:TetR/AcrR family transcriptional regulator n=1 Tax=Ancylobacter sp. Lp-2 TaxID=2881339 RepID=UPI001E282571|nr:TetR/AcrR family transcriptional regulator [Ancylobacter sp. Lp-2]MCB4769465.1 TetR/AcrR family transcriptional regulator [Ancylobacter sp. Lp-2]